MWRMSSPLQKTANFSLVNCGLLSLTRTSMLPNRPHTSLITLIVAALVMAAGILKISGHFENASTMMKNMFLLTGPAKSTWTRCHADGGTGHDDRVVFTGILAASWTIVVCGPCTE